MSTAQACCGGGSTFPTIDHQDLSGLYVGPIEIAGEQRSPTNSVKAIKAEPCPPLSHPGDHDTEIVKLSPLPDPAPSPRVDAVEDAGWGYEGVPVAGQDEEEAALIEESQRVLKDSEAAQRDGELAAADATKVVDEIQSTHPTSKLATDDKIADAIDSIPRDQLPEVYTDSSRASEGGDDDIEYTGEVIHKSSEQGQAYDTDDEDNMPYDSARISKASSEKAPSEKAASVRSSEKQAPADEDAESVIEATEGAKGPGMGLLSCCNPQSVKQTVGEDDAHGSKAPSSKAPSSKVAEDAQGDRGSQGSKKSGASEKDHADGTRPTIVGADDRSYKSKSSSAHSSGRGELESTDRPYDGTPVERKDSADTYGRKSVTSSNKPYDAVEARSNASRKSASAASGRSSVVMAPAAVHERAPPAQDHPTRINSVASVHSNRSSITEASKGTRPAFGGLLACCNVRAPATTGGGKGPSPGSDKPREPETPADKPTQAEEAEEANRPSRAENAPVIIVAPVADSRRSSSQSDDSRAEESERSGDDRPYDAVIGEDKNAGAGKQDEEEVYTARDVDVTEQENPVDDQASVRSRGSSTSGSPSAASGGESATSEKTEEKVAPAAVAAGEGPEVIVGKPADREESPQAYDTSEPTKATKPQFRPSGLFSACCPTAATAEHMIGEGDEDEEPKAGNNGEKSPARPSAAAKSPSTVGSDEAAAEYDYVLEGPVPNMGDSEEETMSYADYSIPTAPLCPVQQAEEPKAVDRELVKEMPAATNLLRARDPDMIRVFSDKYTAELSAAQIEGFRLAAVAALGEHPQQEKWVSELVELKNPNLNGTVGIRFTAERSGPETTAHRWTAALAEVRPDSRLKGAARAVTVEVDFVISEYANVAERKYLASDKYVVIGPGSATPGVLKVEKGYVVEHGTDFTPYTEREHRLVLIATMYASERGPGSLESDLIAAYRNKMPRFAKTFIIACKGQEYPASHDVVVARSPVLAAMLEKATADIDPTKPTIVTITGSTSIFVVKNIVDYIHTDRCHILDNGTVSEMIALLDAAGRFALKGLASSLVIKILNSPRTSEESAEVRQLIAKFDNQLFSFIAEVYDPSPAEPQQGLEQQEEQQQ